MPYVNVRVAGNNTTEQKLRVIERITQVLVEELDKDPAGTFIVIDEVLTDNWGHHGTSVTELRKMAPAAPARKAAYSVSWRLPAEKVMTAMLG